VRERKREREIENERKRVRERDNNLGFLLFKTCLGVCYV
jgi:hypothetical protein